MANNGIQDKKIKTAKEAVISILRGSSQYKTFTWLGFIGSVGGLAYYFLTNDNLSSERGGFLTMGTFLLMYSGINYSKRIRDDQIAIIDKKISKDSSWFRFVTNIATPLAACVTFGGLYCMPISTREKWFLGMFISFVFSQTISVANIVRNEEDASSIEKLD